ncbi:MAG: MBL fold metallo-hydrolase [Nanoarchaeota archaeon]
MRITKLGHCCLLIEHKGVRILTDPGAFSTAQTTLKNIDLILITHEHVDHIHIESLKEVLKGNPKAIIRTNSGVGKLLDKEGLTYQLLTHGQSATIKDILFEGFGTKHEDIYPTVPIVENTGYLIDEYLFYPGDAFTIPAKKVILLALPVEGPWMKLSEAIDYAKKITPKTCFPVHDGRMRKERTGANYTVIQAALEQEGITFIPIEEMKAYEL